MIIKIDRSTVYAITKSGSTQVVALCTNFSEVEKLIKNKEFEWSVVTEGNPNGTILKIEE